MYFKSTIYSICVVFQQHFGFSCRGEQKVTVSFYFGSDCPKHCRIFYSVWWTGGAGTHVTEHRLVLCLISHFLYSSERVLTLKDVPSKLPSLMEVIAQYHNEKAKLKKKKKRILTNHYHLLNHEVLLYCPVVFPAVLVGSKKRKSDFLICWNIIYVRFEKVVMAWVWVAGAPGEFSLAEGEFFVVTTYRSQPFWFNRSSFHVFSYSELNVSLEKENIEETWEEGNAIHLYFLCKKSQASCLMSWKLTLSPSRKKISFMLVFIF